MGWKNSDESVSEILSLFKTNPDENGAFVEIHDLVVSLTLQNVCEKLSEVVSKVASLEERLGRDDACVSHLSCDKSVDHPASTNSNSQWLERSLENIVARLTLIENRLSFLEKQVMHSFAVVTIST